MYVLLLIIIICIIIIINNDNNIVHSQYTNQFNCYTNNGTVITTDVTQQSYCQFSVSCTPPVTNPAWPTNPLIEINPSTHIPYVKLLTCSASQYNGVPFQLTYQVSNTNPPQCSYLITYTDCQKTLNLTMAANTIWQYTQSVSTDLHTNIVQTLSTGPIATLCNTISDGGANLQCILPYAKDGAADAPLPCELMQTINFYCHEHLMLCSNTPGGNSATCTGIYYSCNCSDPLVLNAECNAVDLPTLRNLITDSLNATTTYPTCTILRNNYCMSSAYPTNEFQCFLPYSTTNPGAFCELSTDFTSLTPYCGSNGQYTGVFAYSNTGETGAHTIIYPIYSSFLNTTTADEPAFSGLAKPELNISCQVSSSDSSIFAPLYAALTALLNYEFPPVTLEIYEQIFCQTTFQICKLWQLDGLPLTCNTTLRAELGLRRRLLSSILTTDTSDYENNPLHPVYLSNMITNWRLSVDNDNNNNHNNYGTVNLTDPVNIGNSAFNDNYKFDPVVLTYQLNLLSISNNINLFSMHNQLKKQKQSSSLFMERRRRRLLETNPDIVWTNTTAAVYQSLWCNYGNIIYIYKKKYIVCIHSLLTLLLLL